MHDFGMRVHSWSCVRHLRVCANSFHTNKFKFEYLYTKWPLMFFPPLINCNHFIYFQQKKYDVCRRVFEEGTHAHHYIRLRLKMKFIPRNQFRRNDKIRWEKKKKNCGGKRRRAIVDIIIIMMMLRLVERPTNERTN